MPVASARASSSTGASAMHGQARCSKDWSIIDRQSAVQQLCTLNDAGSKTTQPHRYSLDKNSLADSGSWCCECAPARRYRVANSVAQAAPSSCCNPAVPALRRQAIQAIQRVSVPGNNKGRSQAGPLQIPGLPIMLERLLVRTARWVPQPLGAHPIVG